MDWAQTPHDPLPVFLKFGQVDTEFVYNFRRIEHGLYRYDPADCAEFLRDTAERYFSFLDRLAAVIGPDRMRVCSIFPPCLSDATCHDGYVNGHIAQLESDRQVAELSAALRRLEIPDLQERTRLHASFNREIESRCWCRQWTYVDDFTGILGGRDSIREEWRRNDHHLPFAATDDAVFAAIRRAI
jgi:hypothetical protein